MESIQFYRLVEEILQQSRFARFAFQEIRNKLITTETEKMFFYTDSFLHHLARIRTFLWSENQGKLAETSEQLRKALNCSEDGPLKSPLLFTEACDQPTRFLRWLESLPSADYMDMNIMPIGTLDAFGQDQYHRNLDPETMNYRVRDVQLDLLSLERELRSVESGCESWLKTHNPW